MNVTELYDLTIWIQEEIVDKHIQEKYHALNSVLLSNSNPNQQQQPFESEKDVLLEALNSIRLEVLTKEQNTFLSKLGISPQIGKAGFDKLEDILIKNAIDSATAASRVQEIIGQISQGVSKSNQIYAGLEGCVEVDEVELDDGALIRVRFLGNASISNVKDFSEFGKNWYDIGRGIALAHKSTPEEIKVVGATRGSIIIELLANHDVCLTVAAIVLGSLKVIEKVQEIRKKSEEIRNLKLSNKSIANQLNDEVETEKDKGIKQIVEKQVKALSLEKGKNDGERITALKMSIEQFFEFIEKGGDVDIIVPLLEADEDEENGKLEKIAEIDKLRNASEQIRLTSERIRLLENLENSEEE